MATTKKISRKELKQPDEFVTFWGRTIEFVQLHRRAFLTGISAAAMVALLIWAGSAHFKRQQEKASDRVTQAQNLLASPLGMQPGEGGQEAGGNDPEATNEAVEILEEVTQNYGRTKACRLARILLGRLYYEKQDYDKAIAAYETFLKSKNRKAELTAMAWEGLGYSYEAKGDFAEALGCYEKLSQTELTHVQGWAQMGRARCYEKLGELEKALGAYRELLADQPEHPKAPEARASIARITMSLERDAGEKPPD